MRRIVIEIEIFVGGFVALASALISATIFNDGFVLSFGVLLLFAAFMVGVTHMPFAREKPRWRKMLIYAEIVSFAFSVLFLIGLIHL